MYLVEEVLEFTALVLLWLSAKCWSPALVLQQVHWAIGCILALLQFMMNSVVKEWCGQRTPLKRFTDSLLLLCVIQQAGFGDWCNIFVLKGAIEMFSYITFCYMCATGWDSWGCAYETGFLWTLSVACRAMLSSLLHGVCRRGPTTASNQGCTDFTKETSLFEMATYLQAVSFQFLFYSFKLGRMFFVVAFSRGRLLKFWICFTVANILRLSS